MKVRLRIKQKGLKAERMAVVGFLGVILLGSLLLSLPIASADGKSVAYIDALFTATTSVCVTGLVTVTTALQWSLFGKLVILCLIQIGGLGVVCVITLAFMAARKKITLGERKLIRDSYNLNEMGGIVRMVRRIVFGTLLVEAVGAVFYMMVLIPEFGWVRGGFMSVFNAVSCFCNAGMDIIGETSLREYVSDPLMNLTTMGLICLGSIGFVVWWDVLDWLRSHFGKEKKKNYGLQLHTKIALCMTGVLILGGAVLILIFDWNHGRSLGELPWYDKIMAALFQSVTTRTAGFETIAQNGFSDASSLVSMILMFVGGSPMGTAGGMKTTTVALLLLYTAGFIRGADEVVIFKRKIPTDNIRTAMVIVSLGLAIVLGGTMLLSWVEGATLLDAAYEVVSAIGTVGLTRGLTPSLNVVGKGIVILIMYLGRIGPVTLMLALVRNKKVNGQIHYPEQKILIG